MPKPNPKSGSRPSSKKKLPRKISSASPAGIVGIGGSAGSLEVLQQIVAGLPADFQMAMVIVQHLAPHVPSMVADLLAGKTSLKVEVVRKSTIIRGGVIYVMPPDMLMQ